MAGDFSAELLRKQLVEINKHCSNEGFSVGVEEDVFTWEVSIIGPVDSLYEGACLQAQMKFPRDFPNNPPKMVFTTPMWHPNVYENGEVCISILHPPGTDQFNEFESADERWRPIIGVETILRSVLLMIQDPNLDSPANVDAAKQFKEDPKSYKRKVRRLLDI